eukprot:SAG22_NODE_5446_length_1013_cov_0.786652_2_plen_95_part_01
MCRAADEPSANDFESLAAWSASIAKRRPGNVLRFINLLPNYAPPGALSGNSTAPMSYGEYVEAYIKAVDPQLLCMDHCESSVADMEGAGKPPSHP